MSFNMKPARVVISLLVLSAFIYVFIDSWTTFSLLMSSCFLGFQFVPSVLKTVVTHSLKAAGFILIILMTLSAGRLYCSFLCPLGTIQDVFIYCKRKLFRKQKSLILFISPFTKLRYSIFLIVLLSLGWGGASLLLWLDPYSISGRMITQLVKPVITLSFNKTIDGLQSLNYYGILPVDWVFRPNTAFWFTLAWLLLVIILSFRKGRLYCNTICPVGTLLGLISWISLYKIKINRESCTLCGDCLKVCKAGCIDIKKAKVDFSRCVGCQNCTAACTESAITYRLPARSLRKETPAFDQGRRNWLGSNLSNFIFLPSSFLLGCSAIPVTGLKASELPRRKAISPPGSLGRFHFTTHCTACHLCVSQCPTQVLQPSNFEYSIEGMFQPHMDFRVKYCSYECNICTLICPTGAIRPLTIAEKKRVQPGKARFIKHLCIVITKGTLCGACSEHCPTKACDMVPYKGNLSIPKMNPDICVGCGACEHACPTQPKSIVVDENVIHLIAEKPKQQALKAISDKEEESNEEFPF